MPTIGGVFIPDDMMPTVAGPGPRPTLGGIFDAAVQTAVGQVRYGLPYAVTKALKAATPEDEQFYQEGLARTAQAGGNAAPAQVSDLTSGKVGFGRFVTENLVGSLPYMVGGLVGGIAGGALGGPGGAVAGAIAGGVPTFTGSNTARAVEENGALTSEAASRALTVAPFQAAADAAIGRFLPGMGKFLGGFASTQSGNFARRTAVSMAKAGGVEAVTEAAQQVGERYAAGMNLNDADAAGEYVNAAVTALAVGGVLGAAGGFRRTPAVRKPATQVTGDDLTEHNEAVMSGQLSPTQSAPTQPAPVPLLPSPQMFGREPGGPEIGTSGPAIPVDPAGRAARGPLAYTPVPGEQIFADVSAERPPRRVTPGTEEAAIVRANQPRPINQLDLGDFETTDDLLRRITTPPVFQAPNVLAQPPAPRTDTSVAALTGTPVGSEPVVELPPPARPFQDVDVDDLNKARKAKNADPAIVTAIDAELAARAVDDPFAGVPMNQDIAKLRGMPVEEQIAAVRQLRDDGDTRVGTMRLAERLGIDVNAPGEAAPYVSLDTVMADPVQAAALQAEVAGTAPPPAVTAPVTVETGSVAAAAPELQPTADSSATAIQAVPAAPIASVATPTAPVATPIAPPIAPVAPAPAAPAAPRAPILTIAPAAAAANPEVAAMRALGTERAMGQGKGLSTKAEAEAKRLGLITNDDAMDITPRGRQAFLSTPDGFQETVAAAAQQGYAGAQASAFDRGVRAQVAGEAEAPAFSDFDDLVAFQAGQVWAENFARNGEVRTAAQSRETLSRLGAGKHKLTPEQLQRQSLHRTLDRADLTAVSDSDRATLRRMVRDGATAPEVQQALERVQGGQALFREAERSTPPKLSRPDGRGQPKRKVIFDPQENTPQKAAQRVESEEAVQSYELRALIQLARGEGAITDARAAKMHDMLDQGKLAQVSRLMRDFDPDYEPPAPALRTVDAAATAPAVEAAAIHEQLTGREKKLVAAAYGEKTYNSRAKAQFVNDFTRVVNDATAKVAAAVRVIIERIQAGVMAVAMVLNPVAFEAPGPLINKSQAIAATVTQAVPTQAAAAMSPEARDVYRRLAPQAIKSQVGFMIVDKSAGKLHIFGKAGDYINTGNVLTGLSQQDVLSERVTRSDKIRTKDEIKAMSADERVTPAGQFTTSKARGGVGQGDLLFLNNAQGKSYQVAIHNTYMAERLPQLGTDNNRASFGCINVDPALFEKLLGPNIDQFDQNLVFVLPHDKSRVADFLPGSTTVDLPSSDARATNQQDALVADRRRDMPVSERTDPTIPGPQPKPDSKSSRILDGTNRRRGRWGSISGDADPVFEQAVDGKTFDEIARYMAHNAPSAFHREIMIKVRSLAQMLEKQGMKFDFRIVKPGDEVPAAVAAPGTKALTHVRFHGQPSAVIYINGAEMGPESASNYMTAAHEMLHATTMLLTAYGNNEGVYGKTKLGKAVADLYELQNAIADHFNQRAEMGGLTEFEQRFLERDNNSLADVDELLAWGLTNPEMQRYLNSVPYQPKQSMFSRLVFLIRQMMGFEPRHDSALTELLRVSERVLSTDRAELEAILPRNNPDAHVMVMRSAALNDQGSAGARTAEASNEVAKTVMSAAERAVNAINPKDLQVKGRRVGLGILSQEQFVRGWGREINGLLAHRDADNQRNALRGRIEGLYGAFHQAYEAFEKASPKMADRLNQVMSVAAEHNLDPAKAWEQHTWHGWSKDADGNYQMDPKMALEAARLKPVHAKLVELSNDLRRGEGTGWKLFNDARALNEGSRFFEIAAQLHKHVTGDRELTLGVAGATINPADVFMSEAGDTVVEPAQFRDYWDRELAQLVTDTNTYVKAKKGQGTTSEQKANSEYLSAIEQHISEIYRHRVAMGNSGPYFHLGRFGDNFGSATIRTVNGVVDPEAQAATAKALLDAGFHGVQISADNTKPKLMMRFETVDQAMGFKRVLLELEDQGVIEHGSTQAGPRSVDPYGTERALPGHLKSMIDRVDQDPRFAEDERMTPGDKAIMAEARAAAKAAIQDAWVSSQGDSSISKVLTKRYNVSGYSKDMIRNFAHRGRVSALYIANTSSAPKYDKSFTDMNAQFLEALNGRNPQDPYVIQDIMNELKARDAQTPFNDLTDIFDKARGIAHSFFLGFSPAYGMINMTQLGVMTMPELAKKHGYVKSFSAMRRVTPQVYAVMKAVAAEATKLHPSKWGDVTITEDVLKKAGLDDQTRQFIRRMMYSGIIDIGSMARSLAQVADNSGAGGKLDTYLRLSSAIGLYTETASRLVAALSARDLHGGYGPDAQAYAADVVTQSMFNYQTSNTARQLGKKGFLGPVTPMVTQFMSYSVQLTEKLYSEFRDAVGKARPGESAERAAERRKESQRFLMGHLTAVTALAGTLGLPFATVFARVIEKMVDAVDDDEEPYDATNAWRGFLSDVLGKDVGEVLARGAPRALGFDISSRTGEQSLLPGTDLLTDRRSWKEAIANSTGRSIGAVPSMGIGMLDGAIAIGDGDVLGGMKAMLPVAFKSGVETYRMYADGYVDTKGNKLPLTPAASAYLWQLLGFNPAAKAEYSEARQSQSERRGELGRAAGLLRQGITKAILAGDNDTAQELIQSAMEFDQANSTTVVSSIMSSLERQAVGQAQARALNTPVGVSMKDIAGQRATRYANF